MQTRAGVVVVAAWAALAAACATVPVRVPQGGSSPLAASDAAPIVAQAVSTCRGVRTLTAEVGVSGRVGSRTLRGRVLAGIERPGAIRLEAPAPFGAPVFILVARGSQSVLWFPRDKRVLRDAAVADVIEALTGMHRGADDLLALLSGCLVDGGSDESLEARRFESGWIVAPLTGGAEAFIRQQQQRWRIVGGRAGGVGLGTSGETPWRVGYEEFAAGFPARVRVDQPPDLDVTFRVSQLEANVAIDPAAFDLRVPAGAVPLSLDQLRQMGPLADRAPGTGAGSR
ncbi:MAG: hypothetical protein WCP29_12580 [Acidobacteriota bacterium]